MTATDVELGPLTRDGDGEASRSARARAQRGRQTARDARHADARRAGPAQPAERAGGGRRRAGARAAVRADRRRACATSAAPSADSRSAASRTASSSSTTTVIIRRKSPRCSRRRGRSIAASSSRFSRTGSRGPRRSWTRSVRRSPAADHIVLTDIYAAGEDPIRGRDARRLAAAVRRGVDRAGRRGPARSTTSSRRSRAWRGRAMS